MYKKTVVLGLGNILLKDEGIGVHAINELQKYNLPENVEIVDGGTAGIDAIPPIKEIGKLIIVDAVKGGGKPGAIYRLSPENLTNSQTHHEVISLHDVGILEIISIAEKTGNLPKEVVIIGIEPKEISWGLELSDCVKSKISQIVAAIFEILNSQPQTPN